MELINFLLEQGYEELKTWNKSAKIASAKEIVEHWDGKQWRTFIK